jgi:hypothetical protein
MLESWNYSHAKVAFSDDFTQTVAGVCSGSHYKRLSHHINANVLSNFLLFHSAFQLDCFHSNNLYHRSFVSDPLITWHTMLLRPFFFT